MKWRIAMLCGMAVLVASCAQLGYYVQAAQGQYSLLADAKPIDQWISDPATGARLKSRLMKVKEIRAFAASELGLPDNGSFKTYTDLKRPFVLWNVVATPELSLKPIEWCFPIAGCVNYRGYYDKNEAQRFAKELRSEGYDVQVGGVPAYSTLGWFNDPVLSTFIQYPDTELARLVFHELAHQVVYVPGDSQFNESFATAVEEAGVERWMDRYGDDSLRKSHAAFEQRKNDFLVLLLKYRSELAANYASKAGKDEKRRAKAEIFKNLIAEYQTLKMVKWGGYSGYDRWFAEPLSNAHLAAIATYHDYVPAFRNLLEREKSFPRFYAAVKELSQQDRRERNTELAMLNHATMMAGGQSPASATAASAAAMPGK
jgi:predicted aminopeptidase